jgi:ATP-dependent exoDNAse (exonuclease V) alpha subunit
MPRKKIPGVTDFVVAVTAGSTATYVSETKPIKAKTKPNQFKKKHNVEQKQIFPGLLNRGRNGKAHSTFRLKAIELIESIAALSLNETVEEECDNEIMNLFDHSDTRISDTDRFSINEDLGWQISATGTSSVKDLETKIRRLSKCQMRVLKYVQMKLEKKEQILLYVTGNAGTGKSYLIEVIIELIRLTQAVRSGHDPVIVCAPTGLAAKNVNGETIHRSFFLPINQNRINVDLSAQSNGQLRNRLCQKNFTIIDEFSMVSANMFRAIHERLCNVHENELPFGGTHVIASGDFHQLRPVRAKYAFKMEDLWEKFDCMFLLTNLRQGTDKDWAQLLDRLKMSMLTPADERVLITRIRTEEELETVNADIRLYPTIALTQKHNCREQAKIPENSVELISTDLVMTSRGVMEVGDINQYIPTDYRDAGGLMHSMNLSKGSRIMLIKNLGFGLVNGSTGIVSNISIDSKGQFDTVYVNFDDKNCGLPFRDIHFDNAVGIKRFKVTFQGLHGRTVSRLQFPIIQSWSCTIHKSQGMSVEKGIVSVGREVFEPGMTYVALSRFKTMEGLYLEDYCPARVSTNISVIEQQTLLVNKFRLLKPIIDRFKLRPIL